MSDPFLHDNPSLDSLVAGVADEFMERQRKGERPDIAEYAARYPEAASLLCRVLASLQIIGGSEARAPGSRPAAEGIDPAAPAGWGTSASWLSWVVVAWAWSTRPSRSPCAGPSLSRCCRTRPPWTPGICSVFTTKREPRPVCTTL